VISQKVSCVCIRLSAVLLFCCLVFAKQIGAAPTATAPLLVVSEAKEVQVFGIIYPARFNAAQGDEAHYHLLVWQGGTSANALIETPADDLTLHDALIKLGAHPGNNLTMASWNQRHEAQSTAPLEKVTGSILEVRVAWEEKPAGLPIDQLFRQSTIRDPQSAVRSPQSTIPNPPSAIEWRFAGNRDRWFNHIPLASRPGCLVCLYSCPSGKVGNGALSIHDYVASPARFVANTAILPPDGTPVIVTFRVQP
jgi:hypothetical protein